MNLYIRMLFLAIAALFARSRKRQEYDNESSVSFRCFIFDIDLNIHINNGVFLSFMDLGRIHYLWSVGALNTIVSRGWMPLVGGVEIEYRKSIRLFQKFHVKTKLIYWDEKWFYFEHTIIRGGQVSAVARVKALMIDRKKNKITPETVFAAMGNIPDGIKCPEAISDWMTLPSMIKK